MTLRTRIAAAAGLAVALTVVAVAVAVYLGVRGELRGEVDRSLRASAATIAGPGDRGPADAPADRASRRRVPDVPRQPFGGPEGYVQLVLPTGRVVRAHRRWRRAAGGRPRARHRERRGGRGARRHDRRRHHLRVLTVGLGGGGAIQVAQAAWTRSIASSTASCWCC